MIQTFSTISPHAAQVFAMSHDSKLLAVCQDLEALVYNWELDSKHSFISNSQISAAIILSLLSDSTKIYYILLATKDGHVLVVSNTGMLVYKQFIHNDISKLKVNYSQDIIYLLAGNVIVTLKISFTGSLSICEKINLIGSIKDVLMLGSTYRSFLSPITINQHGQLLYNKYENIFVGVGKTISFYGRMDKREGSWTIGQLEDSLGYFYYSAYNKCGFFYGKNILEGRG
jgi:hypothetical protein